MIYLKTYFYVEHEFQFLAANLEESYPHVEKFIMCEFNRTHTGQPREMLGWEKLASALPSDKLDKVLYLPLDISEYTVSAYNDEAAIHRVNEPVMRSIFMKYVDFKDEDIVVSVDADEIIYEESYPKIQELLKHHSACLLNLYQFFYKKTYLWKNKEFIAPTAAKYSYFKHRFPCNLRYEGTPMSEKAGCHFSWCMSPKEMVYKLDTYSHPQYRFCADEDLLTEAIEKKTYPFNRDEKFDIEEISPADDRIPRSLRRK